MRTTVYLYGIIPGELAGLRYSDALHYKLTSGRALLKRLTKESEELFKKEQRQDRYIEERIRQVMKAIKFTEGLIEELSSTRS